VYEYLLLSKRVHSNVEFDELILLFGLVDCGLNNFVQLVEGLGFRGKVEFWVEERGVQVEEVNFS
jgi:hypothetical protein